ncbi:ENTH domain-containing protein [Golovinomyces cichoracearum]|uniref:ENTH domain-containing protein n=1 Tax=Golovinomyces cichoracearum TaxID=62708 RepID=A0A420HDK0_9PEZI|nr:ENTH domain-containing protein [Golovinomyces cichoracearum]
MASSFEKSVKGATKYKAAPPKSKYIEHILIATHSGEAGVAEIFRSLQYRLRDSTWTIVFKSLITIHLMIREGSPDVTLAYLAKHRNMLAISSFSDVQTQGKNIRHYTTYLNERAKAFKETKCDFVRGATSRLEKLTVEKGLLRQTECVQHQITALLKCDVLDNEPENEITITVFRMLVLDLLSLFHTMNTGLIKILGYFFEMSKIDAERALSIYKNFIEQTDLVVQYLSVARQYEYQTRVQVPKLKHAPVNLGQQLEDYLRDPDFETNRVQYLKEQEAKNNKSKNGKYISPKSEFQPRPNNDFPVPSELPNDKNTKTVKKPDTDLIDFFESIEQNQQVINNQSEFKQDVFQANSAPQFQPQNFQLQQNGFVQTQKMSFQETNQFMQIFNNGVNAQHIVPQAYPNFNVSDMGGYTTHVPFQTSDSLSTTPNLLGTNFNHQLPQQQAMTSQSGELQITNPFRQTMKATNTLNSSVTLYTSTSPVTPSTNRISTNPFAFSATTINRPFSPPPDYHFNQAQQLSQTSVIRPIVTGTNPFAKSTVNVDMNPEQRQTLGSTNPFRKTQPVDNTAESGWPNLQKRIGGGLDSLETIPVFPRTM